MIVRLGAWLSRVAGRVVPDPFVLALGLTVLVFAVGWGVSQAGGGGSTPQSAWSLLVAWAEGLANPGGLAFALQMSLILVTGHALATSPPVRRAVAWLARLPRSGAGAVWIVAAVACIAGTVHWGLGAIVGALLAREIGRAASEHGVRIHYPLLGAAAYAGMAVWHGGLSGSAPLTAAMPGHFAEDLAGVVPLGDTIFSGINFLVMGGLLLSLPLILRAMHPSADAPVRLPPAAPKLPPSEEGPHDGTLVDRLQTSPWPGRLLGAFGLGFLVLAVSRDARPFDLNAVNLGFLCAGLVLQGSLKAYADSVTDGARGAGAIILQFPFYFGILAIMRESAMIGWISEGLVALSTPLTFPTVAFLSAGIVNFFVPSGGGQWAVQAEVLLAAGEQLGVAPQATILAFAHGDAWTNMLQPFWALPLLGVMGLRARDIIGYTAVVFLWMGLVVPVLLTVGLVLFG